MLTIAQRWQQFEANVIPRTAGRHQRQEMRRAFYFGFWSALQAGIEMADESGDDDIKGVLMIQALHDEAKKFRDDVAAGRA